MVSGLMENGAVFCLTFVLLIGVFFLTSPGYMFSLDMTGSTSAPETKDKDKDTDHELGWSVHFTHAVVNAFIASLTGLGLGMFVIPMIFGASKAPANNNTPAPAVAAVA